MGSVHLPSLWSLCFRSYLPVPLTDRPLKDTSDVTVFSDLEASLVIRDKVGYFCRHSSQVGRWHETGCPHPNTHGPSTLGSIRAWDGWNPQKRGRGESPHKCTQLFILVNVSDLPPPASVLGHFLHASHRAKLCAGIGMHLKRLHARRGEHIGLHLHKAARGKCARCS